MTDEKRRERNSRRAKLKWAQYRLIMAEQDARIAELELCNFAAEQRAERLSQELSSAKARERLLAQRLSDAMDKTGE